MRADTSEWLRPPKHYYCPRIDGKLKSKTIAHVFGKLVRGRWYSICGSALYSAGHMAPLGEYHKCLKCQQLLESA